MALDKSLYPRLGSQTQLNTGSPRPTWGFGGSGGPGPPSTAQPGTLRCGTTSHQRAGGGAADRWGRTRHARRMTPPPQPAPRDPACPRSRRPAQFSPRQVSHPYTQDPPAARAVQVPCVRAPACVRGPASRARPRTTPSRARRVCPASTPAAGGSWWRCPGMERVMLALSPAGPGV